MKQDDLQSYRRALMLVLKEKFISSNPSIPYNFLFKLTEGKKVRVDWHQTSSGVCVSIFAKVAIPEQTIVSANQVKCEVCIMYEGGDSSYKKTFTLRQVGLSHFFVSLLIYCKKNHYTSFLFSLI